MNPYVLPSAGSPAAVRPVLRAALLTFLFITAGASSLQAYTASLRRVEGTVEVLRAGTTTWLLAARGVPLGEKDKIRTGPKSMAVLQWKSGDRVQVLANTEFSLEVQKPEEQTFSLFLGRIKATLMRKDRKFQVKTPIAAASVRGTEYLLGYDKESLQLEVYDGAVNVETALGEEMLVESGQRLSVFPDRPLDLPELLEGRVTGSTRDELAREASMALSRDAMQKTAAAEARLAEYQEGKTMLDVNGDRVRLEEYIVRPAANQFKLVVLNDRDSRFDYFTFTGTFNKALPEDLSSALKDIDGKTGSAPDYFMTGYQTARSNTIDVVAETASDGHLVENTLTEDKVLYHPDTDTFETVRSGDKLWQTFYDNYSYRINGTEKFGWQPKTGFSNITAYDYAQFETRILGTVVSDALTEAALRPSTVERPSGENVLHDRVRLDYAGDGTFEQYDFYVIDDEGAVASSSDFSGAQSGASYKDTLLKWNYQQVITASEFGGRKIDLVVEPKILIKSGLLE